MPAREPGQVLLAVGLGGLGILNLVYGDFPLQWQPVPAWVPWRGGLARAVGIISLGCGAGLLWRRAAPVSVRVLVVYVMLWWLLLKLPWALVAPTVEVNWLGSGEIAVLVAAGVLLYAELPGQPTDLLAPLATADRGVRPAQLLFGIALLPIGLSHFVYARQTISLVPAWIPGRAAWAYIGGAGHLAAGVGVLLGVLPRLAATLEAAMISLFTALVWVPGVVRSPTDRLQWTATVVSWTIAAGAWVVADSYRRAPWASRGGLREAP